MTKNMLCNIKPSMFHVVKPAYVLAQPTGAGL